MGGSHSKKSSSNPQLAKSLQAMVESCWVWREQVWGSLGLPLSLRQWGTCWEDPPALQGSWLLAPQDPPCPMLKAVAYRVPRVNFCPLSFPRTSVSPPRGQPLKRLWDRARRSEWEWGLLEHLGRLCQGRGCRGTAAPSLHVPA